MKPDADTCDECGGTVFPWLASNELWNKVRQEGGVICLNCFVAKAESMGIRGGNWLVSMDGSPGDEAGHRPLKTPPYVPLWRGKP